MGVSYGIVTRKDDSQAHLSGLGAANTATIEP